MPEPAPQGILDPSQPDAYVAVNQTQYDAMKAALSQAPDMTQKFAALIAFREASHPRDMLAAAFLSGLSPNAGAPSMAPYPVGSQVGVRLGAAWRTAATDSMKGRDPSSGERSAAEPRPFDRNQRLFRR